MWKLATQVLHDVPTRLPFRVELWDRHDQHIRWVIATASTVAVGHAASFGRMFRKTCRRAGSSNRNHGAGFKWLASLWNLPLVPKPGDCECRGTVPCRKIPGLFAVRSILPFEIAGHRNETTCSFESISEERLGGHCFRPGVKGCAFRPLTSAAAAASESAILGWKTL